MTLTTRTSWDKSYPSNELRVCSVSIALRGLIIIRNGIIPFSFRVPLFTIRFNQEEGGTDDRILFTNAINVTTDISNAFALDMTYRVLYYGKGNKVSLDSRSTGGQQLLLEEKKPSCNGGRSDGHGRQFSKPDPP